MGDVRWIEGSAEDTDSVSRTPVLHLTTVSVPVPVPTPSEQKICELLFTTPKPRLSGADTSGCRMARIRGGATGA